ncbi:P-loop containing nucleoside triphosphate hydrolase protein [Atractiella rhizophila]|nr:P-loop containing nucleoside triphosphate hydrolase protein [Atractiella rhizophila]
MARAMGYLCDESVKMSLATLKGHFLEGKNSDQKQMKETAGKKEFKELISDMEEYVKDPNYAGHPKMEKLVALVLDHLANSTEETKIIVFAQFRDCVDEIVDLLEKQKPLVKPARFVGQGTDKSGKEGIKQKDQKEVIKRFRRGEFNTLVATSIGEEGLDIGEVDLIIIYEAQKSPVRMLQRIGRTGRARDGRIVVLMTKGRDESNWAKAQDNYQHVQNAITSGKLFELYGDVARLIPDKVKPELKEEVIVASEFDPAMVTVTAKSMKAPKGAVGAKKSSKRSVPQGTITGFMSAKGLLEEMEGRSGGKKRKRAEMEDDPRLNGEHMKEFEKWYMPLKGKKPPPSDRVSRTFDVSMDASNRTFVISNHSRSFEAIRRIFGESGPGTKAESWKAALAGHWDAAEPFVEYVEEREEEEEERKGRLERRRKHNRVEGRRWKYVRPYLGEKKKKEITSDADADKDGMGILDDEEEEPAGCMDRGKSSSGFGKHAGKQYVNPFKMPAIQEKDESTDCELPDFGGSKSMLSISVSPPGRRTPSEQRNNTRRNDIITKRMGKTNFATK